MIWFSIGFPRLATSLALSTAALVGLATEASAQATQHRVRVSVKRVLGPGGTLHSNFALQVVEQRIREASTVMNRELGIQLVLSEVVDLPDPDPIHCVPSWFTVDDHEQLEAMEQAAKKQPTFYGWRSNAINVYLIQNHYAGGTCSRCSGQQGEIIVISPSIRNGSVGWAHEFGHYFGLRHTFQGGDEIYAPPSVVSPNWATAGDLIMDTPADPFDDTPTQTMTTHLARLNAWWGATSQHFSQNSAPFLALRNNVMSYYSGISVADAVCTPGQRLRCAATLALHRQHVVEPPCSAHYTDLGHERAGSQGSPILNLSPPRLGRRLHIGTSRAAPSSVALLVLGYSAAFTQYPSGTLVPSPDIVLGTTTDADGKGSEWVDYPNTRSLRGLRLYMQGWCVDPQAAPGWSLTNGVRGDLFHRVESDFNGDGYADVAIGVAEEDVNGFANAGAINVIYGSDLGLGYTVFSQTWHQDSPGIYGALEHGDSFGHTLAHGDFNDDGYADLAIGVPNESIYTVTEAGGVHILYGSSGGLTASGSQFWELSTSSLNSVSVGASDHFGYSLATGDVNGDGFADLAIGAPHYDNGSTPNAGMAVVLYGSNTGLTANGSSRVFGMERWENVGYSLAIDDFDRDGFADVAMGAPGRHNAVGAVHICSGSDSGLGGNRPISQWDSLGKAERGDRFGTVITTGDFNGDGYADLAVGLPDEDLDKNTLVDGGCVQVLHGSRKGLSGIGETIWTQNSVGVTGAEEAGDRFGSALTAGDFDGDGFDDLAIGVPGEDIGSIQDAGMVNVLEGGPCGLSGGSGRFWHQDEPGIMGAAEAGDAFGSALATGDIDGNGCDDLLIGVPKEDHGAAESGVVHLLYGQHATPGLTALYNSMLHQGSIIMSYGNYNYIIFFIATAEAWDRFGSSLSN